METQEEAALAVRLALRENGCCQEAERAFLQGFVGRSNNFMAKKRRGKEAVPDSAGPRDAHLASTQNLDGMLPPNEVVEMVCCDRDCTRGEMPCQTVADVRLAWSAASSEEGRSEVLRRLLWNPLTGQAYGLCHSRVRLILPVGDKRIEDELSRTEGA